MIEYSEELHVLRLIEMLERGKLGCPATVNFQTLENTPRNEILAITDRRPWITKAVFKDRANTCLLCHAFLDITDHTHIEGGMVCPCYQVDDVVKETWIALETKGYLD